MVVIGAVAVSLTLSVMPASSAVGQRIASGDGDAVGKCLDWRGGGTEHVVQMWTCNGGTHQNWRYVPVPGSTTGLMEIHSRKAGYENWCVSATNGEGQQATMRPCNGFYDQFWIKHNHTTTWHSWENFYYGDRCLDVKDYGTSPEVWLFDCLMSQGNQRWKMY